MAFYGTDRLEKNNRRSKVSGVRHAVSIRYLIYCTYISICVGIYDWCLNSTYVSRKKNLASGGFTRAFCQVLNAARLNKFIHFLSRNYLPWYRNIDYSKYLLSKWFCPWFFLDHLCCYYVSLHRVFDCLLLC